MQNVLASLFTLYAVTLVVVYVAWTRANRPPGRKLRHACRRCPHTDDPIDGSCTICGIFGR